MLPMIGLVFSNFILPQVISKAGCSDLFRTKTSNSGKILACHPYRKITIEMKEAAEWDGELRCWLFGLA